MEDLYSKQLRKKALRIIKDPHSPQPQTVQSVAVWQAVPQHQDKNHQIQGQFHPAGNKTAKQLNC